MGYNISKELFEAVMNRQTKEIICLERGFTVDFSKGACGAIMYNDFFFKCKEWAYKQGYQINSWSNGCSLFIKPEHEPYLINYKSDSEQQAVFDACQYILNTYTNCIS